MTTLNYKHQMAAHCESGTLTTMLNNGGLQITEPMLFGITSGIFFGYFHKMKSFTFPTFIVRSRPGEMRKVAEKRLGVKFDTKTFRDPEQGMAALDHLLEQNIPVGNQVDFFYMSYLPEWERVHINVHYMTVVGKEGNEYIVSDSYFPKLARLDRESLRKAKFAGGSMSPKGFIFHPVRVPVAIDYEKAIARGIKRACFNMLKLPVPFIGIKGIRKFSRKIVEWPQMARDTDHLSHEIMKINILLEDQGTGGAGFRYMYATFLQQAAEKLNRPEYKEFSKQMMEIGDGWREISLFAARIGKNRDLGPDKMKQLGEMLNGRADAEERFFRELYKTV
jgi:hypothetical protein